MTEEFVHPRRLAKTVQDGLPMWRLEPGRPRATRTGWVGALALAFFASGPGRGTAVAATLSQSDLSLVLYASPDGGASWSVLGANALAGFFGPHRCLCPDTLSVQIQLTTAGQTSLGASTLAASFLLGKDCLNVPAACASVGQVSFTGTQTAVSPTFSSDLVFKTVAGSTGTCASLTAGSTTLWAALAQDGVTLPFGLSLALPVSATTLGAPTAVTAQPANRGILVSWTPPADAPRVAAYQVLCLPRPSSAFTAGYESCGLTAVSGATSLTPADTTELCAAPVSASITSLRLTGLTNGIPYTVGVVAIDSGGGVSVVSPPAQATPQPTLGFYEKYKHEGGAATGCSLVPARPSPCSRLGLALAAAVLLLSLRRRGRRCAAVRIFVLWLAGGGAAQAQISRSHDDWAEQPAARGEYVPVEWGLEVGVSLYRPAVDGELGNGAHPFADTFSSSRRLMSEAELSRYLGHRWGTWGVGLRGGYYKATAAAFLVDGSRSGDETGLRLIPFGLSAIYRADDLPGLRKLPLIPYAKAGLDGVVWTASSSGSGSQTGFSTGWHVAGGLLFSLSFLAGSGTAPGAIAGPGALFFEWDYSAVNGLGFGHALHVGDNTWFAGLMFDL